MAGSRKVLKTVRERRQFDRDAARYRIDALEEANRELHHELATERGHRKREASVLQW